MQRLWWRTHESVLLYIPSVLIFFLPFLDHRILVGLERMDKFLKTFDPSTKEGWFEICFRWMGLGAVIYWIVMGRTKFPDMPLFLNLVYPVEAERF